MRHVTKKVDERVRNLLILTICVQNVCHSDKYGIQDVNVYLVIEWEAIDFRRTCFGQCGNLATADCRFKKWLSNS